MKYIQKHLFLFFAAFSAFIFTSCEKVIDIDLNNSDSRVVVEAVVTHDGTNYVKLSKTNNFSDNNNFEKISNATVLVKDDAGNNFPMNEVTSGYYTHSSFTATQGATYDLEVNIEGQAITSQSSMPHEVILDSVTFEKPNGGFGGRDGLIPICHFNDPANIKNYYRIKVFKDGVQEEGYLVLDDDLFDGNDVSFRLFQYDYEEGVSVKVQLFGIDEANYRYFQTLSDNTQDGLFAATPGNPDSNLKGDAIGFFGAYTMSEVEEVVPKE